MFPLIESRPFGGRPLDRDLIEKPGPRDPFRTPPALIEAPLPTPVSPRNFVRFSRDLNGTCRGDPEESGGHGRSGNAPFVGEKIGSLSRELRRKTRYRNDRYPPERRPLFFLGLPLFPVPSLPSRRSGLISRLGNPPFPNRDFLIRKYPGMDIRSLRVERNHPRHPSEGSRTLRNSKKPPPSSPDLLNGTYRKRKSDETEIGSPKARDRDRNRSLGPRRVER